MRERELFSTLTALPPLFIRLDGRAFHRLARVLSLSRPFDDRFGEAMARVARRLVADSGLSPVFAYTFSDECSLFFTRLPFDGRVEKLDSVLSGYASSALTLELGLAEPVAFDARVVFVDPVSARDYLVARQSEAWRNHVNAYAQAVLLSEGLSPRQVAARLRGVAAPAIHDLVFERGVNLAGTPAWQRRGTMIYRKEVRVTGRDPRTGTTSVAVRSRAVIDRDLPLFSSDEGRAFLAGLIPGLDGVGGAVRQGPPG
ncbi:MAG TPA: tRNA(His) guanylyltransferase Thg1 family protein [Methanoregulaceae archaeon]|nr:tRNA(His) guanylyltransferase Thg1 family protein [Methanoregulaceae archaeon]